MSLPNKQKAMKMNVPIYLSLNKATQGIAASTAKTDFDVFTAVKSWILLPGLAFCGLAILYMLVFLFLLTYNYEKAIQLERKVTLFGLGCVIAFVLYVIIVGAVIAFKA